MGKKILIIDDDNLVRKSLGQVLGEAGYGVDEAADGQTGLDKAIATHPDVIICDIRMPGLDGLQMVERLRQDPWGKHVPVVILSTDDSATSLNQALTAGVTVYLSKSSLSPDQIAEQLKQAL